MSGEWLPTYTICSCLAIAICFKGIHTAPGWFSRTNWTEIKLLFLISFQAYILAIRSNISLMGCFWYSVCLEKFEATCIQGQSWCLQSHLLWCLLLHVGRHYITQQYDASWTLRLNSYVQIFVFYTLPFHMMTGVPLSIDWSYAWERDKVNRFYVLLRKRWSLLVQGFEQALLLREST